MVGYQAVCKDSNLMINHSFPETAQEKIIIFCVTKYIFAVCAAIVDVINLSGKENDVSLCHEWILIDYVRRTPSVRCTSVLLSQVRRTLTIQQVQRTPSARGVSVLLSQVRRTLFKQQVRRTPSTRRIGIAFPNALYIIQATSATHSISAMRIGVAFPSASHIIGFENSR
jgi:hypothetical protein